MNIAQYQRLKENAERTRRKADQAVGAKEQQYTQLKRDFDCDTLEAAKDLQVELEKQEKELQEQLDTGFTALTKKYPDLLK